MFLRLVELLFPVRPGERRLTLILFLHSLFAVGSFMTGRSVRDALFLVHSDRALLPWMYVFSAVGVTISGLVYSRYAGKIRRDRMALLSSLTFSGLFVAAFIVERTQPPAWIYSAIYVYVEIMGALCLVQFWTLTNELFNAREAKRLYGLIGSGGTFANIVIGFASAKIATKFGADSLLVLCAFLLVGCAVASFFAGRAGRQRIFAKAASGKKTVEKRTGGASRVFQSGHLRTVAALAAITFFVTTLVDFEFKVIAGNTYAKDQLAAYFGYFYAVVGVLALGLQLFGTGKLLNRFGVIGALMVLPLTLAGGNLALAIVPAIFAASMAKGADTLFRYSINDATTQILYLPVPSQARAASKAFIDGVVKPVFIGLAGLTLIGYRATFGGDPVKLAIIGTVLGGVWIALVWSLRSQYIRSLQDNLRNRRLDLESARYKVMDASTNVVLNRALESGDPREVLNALELLPHLENIQVDHRVEALLDHPMPEIRIAALDYYVHRQTMRFANSIFRKFDDPDARVRARAIDAFCAIGRDKAVRNVRHFLKDQDPAILSAAVVGMIRYGGLDGVLMAAEALKTLITHDKPVMRQHAAKVLGAIGVQNFYQPVLELMSDGDALVRREAVRAAGMLKSPEFVIPLIYKTQSAETGHEAIEALCAFGGGIAPTLAKVIDNRAEEPQIRRSVARVLGRLGTPEAVDIICRHLDEPDEELRTRLYRALARATKGKNRNALSAKVVNEALQRELDRAFYALWAAETLALGKGPDESTPRSGPKSAEALLGSALLEKLQKAEERVFLLLAVLYPDADMEHIFAGMRDAGVVDGARKRANAVELLDNLLDRNIKKWLLPLLDDTSRADKLRNVAELYAPPSMDKDALIVALCKDDSAWVRACATYYALHCEVSAASQAAVELATDDVSFVREMALLATLKLAPDKADPIAEKHLTDDEPVVRRQAALITTRRSVA